MLKFHLKLLAIHIFLMNNLMAHHVPKMLIPEKKLQKIETFRSSYFIKTTEMLHLKGHVKYIIETEQIKTTEEYVTQFPLTYSYKFSKNGNLLEYMENDTMKGFGKSIAKIENYNYNETGNMLKEYVVYDATYPQNAFKIIRKFDDEGYLAQEIYQSYYADNYYPEKHFMFDYTLHYLWSANRDTVHLKYKYKTEKTNYERLHDTQYIYRKVSQLLYDSITTNEEMTFEFFTNYSIVKTDSLANITSVLYLDRAIKNSFNIDNLYEFTYNTNNEVVTYSHSNLVHGGFVDIDNQFKLQYQVQVKYLNQDKYSNWRKKKYIEEKSGIEETYSRSIVYY